MAQDGEHVVSITTLNGVDLFEVTATSVMVAPEETWSRLLLFEYRRTSSNRTV